MAHILRYITRHKTHIRYAAPVVLVVLYIVVFTIFVTPTIPKNDQRAISQLLHAVRGFIWTYDDIDIYFARAQWSRTGGLPYRDYGVEYPPLATIFFGLPSLLGYLLFLPQSTVVYRVLYVMLMCGVLWNTIKLIKTLCQKIGTGGNPTNVKQTQSLLHQAGLLHATPSQSMHSLSPTCTKTQSPPLQPWYYLLLVPASIFFTFSRFDLLCSLVVLGSLIMLCSDRPRMAWILVAVAFCIKWYSVLLVPVYIAYYFHHRSVSHKELLIGMGLSLGQL